ncbi:MAG: flagellar basal-body rod protein FlgG [Pseudomonadota bacterium]
MTSTRICCAAIPVAAIWSDFISNNIANMSTSAYRPRVAEFSDLVYQQYLTPGTLTSQLGTTVPAGIQLGTGVRASTVSIEITQGSMRQTGGELDLGIDGPGFLEITLPDGETAFTRDGKLNRSQDGEIVTMDGYPLADGITLPSDANQITISRDGEITAYFDNQAQGQSLGVISLATFVNEKGLEAIGDNMFRETEASGQANRGVPGSQGYGTVRQGFLEDSSVDVVKEISDLIEAQRGYELNSKVITASDEMLAATTRLR